ncbi:MAG: AsnC family transcriptional regulator [Candidatus Methanomethylicia archaeon]|nr:AsnC family transcriptional regulator [Candidatus Methanomethylicia archaeon]
MPLLDYLDYKILTILGKNPLATVIELSKELGINVKTLSKRMKLLMKEKVLYNVSAQICPVPLELEPIIVFIDTKLKNIPAIENVGEKHPYTRFSTRCLGSINGLMKIFTIPRNSIKYLLELFDRLREIGLIEKYRYVNSIAKWSYVESDFTYYDPIEDDWKFNWKLWGGNVDSIENVGELEGYPPSILHRMDENDMKILEELSINARVKLKDLSEKLGIPEYHLSRRIKFYLDNGVIEGFRLSLYLKASNLFNQFIFKCICPVNITARFAKAIKKLPFPLTFMPTQEGFVLIILLPPLGISYLGEALQKYVEKVEFMWADYRTSRRYYFYGEPFKGGRWQADKKTLVDNVLERLNLK